MIEKISPYNDGKHIFGQFNNYEMGEKINELVDAVNELQLVKKALDVAVDALKEITNNDYDADWQNDLAQATLEKIKDIK